MPKYLIKIEVDSESGSPVELTYLRRFESETPDRAIGIIDKALKPKRKSPAKKPEPTTV